MTRTLYSFIFQKTGDFIEQRRPWQVTLLHLNFHICTAHVCKTLRLHQTLKRKNQHKLWLCKCNKSITLTISIMWSMQKTFFGVLMSTSYYCCIFPILTLTFKYIFLIVVMFIMHKFHFKLKYCIVHCSMNNKKKKSTDIYLFGKQ